MRVNKSLDPDALLLVLNLDNMCESNRAVREREVLE